MNDKNSKKSHVKSIYVCLEFFLVLRISSQPWANYSFCIYR